MQGSLSGRGRQVLRDSRVPQAETMRDMGAISGDRVIAGITLVFNRSASQEAELQDLLSQQQDKTSPQYHQWLSPEIFGRRFGMTDGDLQTTADWLAASGFQAMSVSPSRDRITFTGTASQVEVAFGTELHRYQGEGDEHFAPSSDLTLPSALAPVTAAVLHLSDFRPKPNAVLRAQPRPLYTTSATQAHFLTPSDLTAMYDYPISAGKDLQGQGQSIAVVGQSYANTSAAGPVNALLGLGGPSLSAVLVPGSGVEAISPGDELESELDLEYALGTATKANVFLVFVGDQANYSVYDALAYAIQERVSPVISISYSTCETLLSMTALNQANAVFAQAAAQGQSLIAASGDSGSTACAPVTTSSGLTTTQIQASAINFPADSPYVTAIGGTQMAAASFAAGNTTYWASATGVDAEFSLLSYVPEVAWNEGSATAGILAAGGGTSSVVARPAWQTGVPGLGSGGYRLVPDLAFQASTQNPGFLVCSDDPYAVQALGSTATCASGPITSSTSHFLAGGTSFAAPAFAGMVAVLNQTQNALGQGNLNPTLYGLAGNAATYAKVFHDVTAGTIACVSGAANCTAAGQVGYSAAPGYDEATGLGSLDLGALIQVWPPTAASQKKLAVAYLQLPVTTMTGGTSLTVTMGVAPGVPVTAPSPLPTGTFAVAIDGTVVSSGIPAVLHGDPSMGNAGTTTTATYTFTAPATTGSHLIAVTYSGDATYSSSLATGALLVGNAVASGTFAVAANNLTLSNNTQGRTQVTVTSSGYSGRVFWSLKVTGSASLTACYLIPPVIATGVNTANLTIGVGTACNAPLTAGIRRLKDAREQVASSAPPSRQLPAPVAITSAALTLWFVRRKRGRAPGLTYLLPAAVLLLLTLGTGGCGGGKNTATTPAPVTPVAPVSAVSTYTLTLTGQDSVNTAISTSATFTLTVQ